MALVRPAVYESGASNKLRLTGTGRPRRRKLKRGHYDLGIRPCQMAPSAPVNVRRLLAACLYTRRQSTPLVTERKKASACTKRAPRALKPRLIIAHTPNIAAPRKKTARAAAPRAHRHDLRHDGISAVLNSARAAVEPRASLRTAPPRPVARLPSRRAPKKSRSRAARAAPTDKKA